MKRWRWEEVRDGEGKRREMERGGGVMKRGVEEMRGAATISIFSVVFLTTDSRKKKTVETQLSSVSNSVTNVAFGLTYKSAHIL